ncbi:hypothetical protein F7725_011030, partial [Dissostichus mawsoni]
MDQDAICCSICLDVLKELATTSCGHSFCMNCIQTHWDKEDEKEVYSCPQCRQIFTPRPDLLKSIVFCMNCIQTHWDKEDEKEVYSCPQCRQSFTPRPDLLKS